MRGGVVGSATGPGVGVDMRWYQPILYLWALPATALGAAVVPIVLLQGGAGRVGRCVVGGRMVTGTAPWGGKRSSERQATAPMSTDADHCGAGRLATRQAGG